jgi:hypothetical protein
MIERRRSYFGFDLETEVEPIEAEVPPDLRPDARDALTDALLQGETAHPDQGRIRRTLRELDELWRRSGGSLHTLGPDELRLRIREQLEGVISWEDFLRTTLVLDPAGLVDHETRHRLEALPGRLHLHGDAVPLDYEVENGSGVARIRLREGQARRLRAEEVPRLDRPLRFAVQRGSHPPILADTVPALQALLKRVPKLEREEQRGSNHDSGGRGRRRRAAHQKGKRRGRYRR